MLQQGLLSFKCCKYLPLPLCMREFHVSCIAKNSHGNELWYEHHLPCVRIEHLIQLGSSCYSTPSKTLFHLCSKYMCSIVSHLTSVLRQAYLQQEALDQPFKCCWSCHRVLLQTCSDMKETATGVSVSGIPSSREILF